MSKIYEAIPAFNIPESFPRKSARRPRVDKLRNMSEHFSRENRKENQTAGLPQHQKLTTNPKKIRRTLRAAARRKQYEEQKAVLEALAGAGIETAAGLTIQKNPDGSTTETWQS